ncbi:response regulator transcription factor [Sulfurovum sp.]|jgi:two-component system OmpR family response regulator|uniref:response regulator transcription factor n=1 Tax=Sulfurovum sp. TaxID=1969726 RepID=UPI002A35E239|nr:response regulator transcription factor [Sulfurovum sp.]MDD2451525.1 response regulator transcription factor [Sulfurovum sp.]MDD3500146.1 response regulator transcription factor [Sulfurovum sp.]MDY0402627.1 response regulator transcription factor [Sulfurovum sp.]
MSRILMVEDDPQLTELLETYLSGYGMDVFSVSLPSVALEKLEVEQYDLVLLDLGLPQMDGLELCKRIKTLHPHLPVIISTARADVSDKVVAFDVGADDYIAKPYEPRELVARIQATIKRYERFSSGFNDDLFRVDKVKMQISKEDEVLDLTLAEYEIFALLLEKKHQVVSREFIVNSINAVKWQSSDRSIDVIISRIRQKIGDETKHPKYIKSVRGIGYKYIGE